MSGWYNPLPIGQSATNPTGEVGRYAREVGGLWFFRLPGQCGVIALPRTAHRTLLHESPFLLLHTTSSHSSHSLRSLFLAFFIAHPPTLANPNCASIATSGNIGGNDIPWQGQRLPMHHLRQWNQICVRHGTHVYSLWALFYLGFSLGSLSITFS